MLSIQVYIHREISTRMLLSGSFAVNHVGRITDRPNSGFAFCRIMLGPFRSR